MSSVLSCPSVLSKRFTSLLPPGERIMKFHQAMASVVAIAACTAATNASIISFTQQTIWEGFVTSNSLAVLTETFNAYSDGFYAAPLAGNTGPVNWVANATGGIYVQGGVFSTNNSTELTFDFAGGVGAVSGNFFGTDASFNVIPSMVYLTLQDGTSYFGFVSAADAYTGFYSTGALITSLRFSAVAPGGAQEGVYPSVNNLYFGVIPAPSAIALLGVAGLFGRRRR